VTPRLRWLRCVPVHLTKTWEVTVKLDAARALASAGFFTVEDLLGHKS
jgi:hypothetical protein